MHDYPQYAAEAIAGVLEAPAIEALWARHYVSRKDENPAQELASRLRAASGELEKHPDLVTLMGEVVDIEHKALGRAQMDEDERVTLHREALGGLASYLSHFSANLEIPEKDALPIDQRRILDMLARQTAQKPCQPLRSSWRGVKHTAEHTYESAKAHPWQFGTYLATSLGALGFMNMRMGSSANVYIDPQATTVMNLSLDALNDPDFQIVTDPSFLNMDLQPSCHDHLIQMIGQTGADVVKNTLDMGGLFPQHCSRLKTLATDAQAGLQGGYDFINSRIGFLIRDPSTDLANTFLPDSPFRQAFNTAAHQTAEMIYAANTVENVVLHSIVFFSAMTATVKLSTMETGEARELARNTRDFFHRTVLNTPLNYAFGLSAAGYAYAANAGVSPDMMWMGLGGVLAGHFSHAVLGRLRSRSHAQDMLIEADESLTRFADPDFIVTDALAGEEKTDAPRKTWRDYLKKPAIVTGVTGALIAADSATTGGQVTGSVLGGLGVLVPFLAYNVPEDAGLHVIFAIAGGTAGAAYSGVVRAKRAIGKVLPWSRKTAPEAGP